jgi:hypothetical protein
MEEGTTQGIPVCRRLRTRLYYVVGRDHADLREESPNAQYWCSRTAVVLGPDDVYCCPTACQPGRSCFEST